MQEGYILTIWFNANSGNHFGERNDVFQANDVEALVTLRLTSLQAKVYLVLASIGEAKVSTISKNVRVARQDIYRIIAELQKLGLIEKMVKSPCVYRALPMEEAVSVLLHHINKDVIDSRQKGMNLLKRHKAASARGKDNLPEEEYQFVLISEKQAKLKRLSKSTETAQKSIDIVCSWTTLLQSLSESFSMFQKALKKGVNIRWITEKPLDCKARAKTAKLIMQNPLFKLGFVPFAIEKRYWIYDKKEVFIALNPKTNYARSPALWTNAVPLIELAQHYFDSLWKETAEAEIRT